MISPEQAKTRTPRPRTSIGYQPRAIGRSKISRELSGIPQASERDDSECLAILSLVQAQPYASRPNHEKVFYEFCKRALDIVGSLVALVGFLPLILIAAVITKITSPGPLIFKQRRVGLGGVPFWCLKIRTMYVDAEERLRKDPHLREQFEANYKIKNDPRITPIGAFLRKTSIDELPQFINVLKGEMTLIGPRPIQNAELSKYGEFREDLLSVKPGLGGLWQVCGRSDTSYEQRVAMDALYARHRCLRLDLLLLLLTVKAVFCRNGAC